MSSVESQLLGNFRDSREYRHAFVEEKVRTQLALQIKAIREQREMSRPEFAALLEKAPSWVFRLEDPNQSPPTISTLLQVAEAFDVDLDISFKSFSDLLDRMERLNPESYEVPSFDDEVKSGAFNQRMSQEELGMAVSQLGGTNTGGYTGFSPHSLGERRLFLMTPTGERIKTKRSPRIRRRTALAHMQRSA